MEKWKPRRPARECQEWEGDRQGEEHGRSNRGSGNLCRMKKRKQEWNISGENPREQREEKGLQGQASVASMCIFSQGFPTPKEPWRGDGLEEDRLYPEQVLTMPFSQFGDIRFNI